MAAKKKSQLKLGKRAQKIFQNDLIQSVAIVSIVLNILFLVGWGVLINGQADKDLYDHAKARLCQDNYNENVNRIIKESDNETDAATKAIELKILCVKDDFQPFYEEAIELYTQNILSHN